jgi:hypothetical protein
MATKYAGKNVSSQKYQKQTQCLFRFATVTPLEWGQSIYEVSFGFHNIFQIFAKMV